MHPVRVIALLTTTSLLVATAPAGATTVDVATGTSGTLFFGQSFNETRGVDVNVQGPDAQVVTSMTLRGLNIGVPSATVGARIYDTATQVLIASGNVPVSGGSNLTVTVSIAAVLAAGANYRLCFFVDAEAVGGSGTMFDPAPPSIGGFPYTESTGTLQIVQAYSTASDAFPNGPNIFVPLISVEMTPVSVGANPATWGGLRSRYR